VFLIEGLVGFSAYLVEKPPYNLYRCFYGVLLRKREREGSNNICVHGRLLNPGVRCRVDRIIA
jgi:hypothetical protein